AAGLTYHLGFRHALKNADFVTCGHMGPLAVLNTTAIDAVKARVVCHQPGAPYSISPCSTMILSGCAFANSGNRTKSVSVSIGILEILSVSSLGYMYVVWSGGYSNHSLRPCTWVMKV